MCCQSCGEYYRFQASTDFTIFRRCWVPVALIQVAGFRFGRCFAVAARTCFWLARRYFTPFIRSWLPLCAEFRQWSLLCVIAPLRMALATGSPVNPIAIL
jgi:hypothetical protein